jgi:ribose transport system substrate-binding protein
VAHVAFDGVDSGYRNAKALIEAIGGRGNIVALGGVPDNPPAKQRLAGLQRALDEHPEVRLLDSQPADWDATKAQGITETWIARYGDRIDGIFSASDGMSVGAVAALRARGLNGRVPVTGSDGSSDGLRLVKSGDMVSTMFIDPVYMGAITLAMAYAAQRGDLDPSRLSHEQRAFYLEQTLVTEQNVDEFLDRRLDPGALSYQTLERDFWARSAGPLHRGE